MTNFNTLAKDLHNEFIIEFKGEKTHYFNGGMIACRCTVRM